MKGLYVLVVAVLVTVSLGVFVAFSEDNSLAVSGYSAHARPAILCNPTKT
jgi:low affinity Fe/Cu permease